MSTTRDLLIGCVGKPSAGKSSFLNAATDANAKVGKELTQYFTFFLIVDKKYTKILSYFKAIIPLQPLVRLLLFTKNGLLFFPALEPNHGVTYYQV